MTSQSSRAYSVMKRVLDVGGAVLLLIVLAPLLGAVAGWIWWDNGRPVFFTQIRAGRHGQPYRIFKFRTLSTGPKDPTRPSDYTTRAGALLRRWAIDELPQLWNVLRGEMSLVGPRPALPQDVQHYSDRERTRLQVRPGLTGWAQIHGRNAISWSKRIELDLNYLRARSFALDVYILFATIPVLLRGNGASGPQDQNMTYSVEKTSSSAPDV